MNALRFSPYRLTGIILTAVVLVALTSAVSAASYYVDYTGGSDNNAGTSATSAWQHCPGDPSAAGTAGAASLAAGDIVVFKGGVNYVLTGATGIALRSSGVSTAPITFDGNSAGTWGTGRAKITDNNGARGVSAFTAPAAVSYLNFKFIEFAAIGGAAVLPADPGSAIARRFGGGLQFSTVNNVTVDNCVFHDLGYWFNQKPMNAAAISGTGIAFTNGSNITVSNCEFYHLGAAIEMYGATSLSNIAVTGCRFHDSVCWTIDLPPVAGSETNVTVSSCSETNNDAFAPANWTGYGPSPRSDIRTATVGSTVTFTVTAASTPRATYQWRKNGTVIAGATSATLALAAVTAADSATYTVLATNSSGSTVSNDAVLTVLAPPVITTQPTAQSVTALSNVTFTVAASGSPAPTYQWLKNGAAIGGATNATLTLSSVSSTDAANYAAVATNSAGSVTSNTAALTVVAPVRPTITTQPTAQSAAPGSTVQFTVAASGTPTPTYQWTKNGVAVSGWTNATLTLPGVTTNDVAAYAAIATNSAGSVTSNSVRLTLAAAPVITTQPVSQTASAASTVTFMVAASGSPTPTYQWLKNGVAIAGWTNATLTLSGISTNDVARYSAIATNSVGSATSNVVTLSLSSTSTSTGTTTGTSSTSSTSTATTTTTSGSTPSSTTTTTSTTATSGSTPSSTTTTSTASTASTSPSTTSGSTPTTSTSTSGTSGSTPTSTSSTTTSTTSSSGTASTTSTTTSSTTSTGTASTTSPSTGTTSGSMPSGTSSTTSTTTSTPAVTVAEARLSNVSVRATAGSGAKTLTVGFVVRGSAAKTVLIRGVGPTLGSFGVSGVLADPVLSLYTGTQLLAKNAGWQTSPDATRIPDIGRQVGAFAFDNGSLDSAIVPSLSDGAYTAQITSASAGSGSALLEVYDAAPLAAARLVNVSVLTNVASESDLPIIGFVVSGSTPKRLLIRAVGPSLAAFRVDNPMSDPKIEIYSNGVKVAANDNWSGDPTLSTAFSQVGAFAFDSANSKDAALIFTANPGGYSAVVSGTGGATGMVMLEVYELP